MKKYNKPTIETLALETVDVIAVSGALDAEKKLLADNPSLNAGQVHVIRENIAEMGNQWSW